MPSVNDWAAKCAREIRDELPLRLKTPSEERIAAMIIVYLNPILEVLRDARREHRHDEEGQCCAQCKCNSGGSEEQEPNHPNFPCDCGADDLNNRIDKVLE